VGKSSGLAEKSKNRIRKHQEKHTSEKEKARDDAVVEISVNTILNLRLEEPGQVNPPPVSGVEVAAQADAGSDEDSGANSEVEEQELRLAEKKRKGKGKAKDQGGVKPFAQRDLVSLAFAGDKVVQVCLPPIWCIEIGAYTHLFARRTFKRLSNERSSKTRRRKWTRLFPDGYAPFSTSTTFQHLHAEITLGFVGWDRYQKSTTKIVPRQEGCWHQPTIPRRLRKSAHHHL